MRVRRRQQRRWPGCAKGESEELFIELVQRGELAQGGEDLLGTEGLKTRGLSDGQEEGVASMWFCLGQVSDSE